MHQPNTNDHGYRKDLLLVSALLHSPLAPEDRVRANSHRVLRHALQIAGLWHEDFAIAFHGDPEDTARFPVVSVWYSELIHLTESLPESERLLEGAGNLIDPSGAYFTACWPTPAGRTRAKQLLREHPEWGLTLPSENRSDA